MDIADISQDNGERELQYRLNARVIYQGRSANECQNVHCGLLISSARQIAVPGCQYCTECAAEFERAQLLLS